MTLETAIQFTQNYLKDKEFRFFEPATFESDFTKIEIKEHPILDEAFCIEIFNLELSYFMDAYFTIPELESDYHNILSLLKIQ